MYKFELNNVYIYTYIQGNHIVGKCVLYSPDQIFYKGLINNGIPQQHAYVQFIDKQCEYDGEVLGWEAHGHGIFLDNRNKIQIQGVWNQSKFILGKIKLMEDRNVEEISIVDFQKRKGVIKFRDKRVYCGQLEIRKLIPHGFGRLQMSDSSNKVYYEGWWEMGQIMGRGEYVYRNGSLYRGEVNKGKKQGFGKFIFANKKRYEGYWKNGKQDGIGCLYQNSNKSTQTVVYGNWNNGKLQKKLQKREWKAALNNWHKKQIQRTDIKEDKQLDETNTNMSFNDKYRKRESFSDIL